MAFGRPTDYSQEVCDIAIDYLDSYHEKYEHQIPSLVGLCKVLNRGKSTLYDWCNKDHPSYHADFSDIVSELNDRQALALMNGGLSNAMNASITKLILTKHGYSDKQETDVNVAAKDTTALEAIRQAIESKSSTD
jgi:hypothetical protein